MHNYIESHARNAGFLGGLSLSSLIGNWQARRSVQTLSRVDDHLLRDIGVSREDVQWAAGLPLTVNAAVALEERMHQTRRSESARLKPHWLPNGR